MSAELSEAMREFCTLTLGRETYGVPLPMLREVIEPQAATRVPLAPPELRGVINLRGELTPVLVLDFWLGLPATAGQLERRPWLAVLAHGRHYFGVLVDQVGTVRTDADTLSPPPEGQGQLIEGVASAIEPALRVLRIPALLRRIEIALSLEHLTKTASLTTA